MRTRDFHQAHARYVHFATVRRNAHRQTGSLFPVCRSSVSSFLVFNIALSAVCREDLSRFSPYSTADSKSEIDQTEKTLSMASDRSEYRYSQVRVGLPRPGPIQRSVQRLQTGSHGRSSNVSICTDSSSNSRKFVLVLGCRLLGREMQVPRSSVQNLQLLPIR